ncbi:MAG: hypothetical protein LUG18_03370 [Candidatus Azobacteroides sp.]|nr:hypothetical protein [Candidatus Azobacteroides sp.]
MDCQPHKNNFSFRKKKTFIYSPKLAISLIGSKWKAMVICHLKDGIGCSVSCPMGIEISQKKD